MNFGERQAHNAIEDAGISMALFNAYRRCDPYLTRLTDLLPTICKHLGKLFGKIIWANNLQIFANKYCKLFEQIFANNLQICVFGSKRVEEPSSTRPTLVLEVPHFTTLLIAPRPRPPPLPCLCSVQWDPARLYQLQMATLHAPRIPGFSSRHPEVDAAPYLAPI